MQEILYRSSWLALLADNDVMAPETTSAESPGHWNYGSENCKPLDPSLYDEHWYKRPMNVVGETQSLWWRLLAYLRRECRWCRKWTAT